MVSKGLITLEDIEAAKSKDTTVLIIGLPAYCILQMILRSAKADSVGLILSEFHLSSDLVTLSIRKVFKFFRVSVDSGDNVTEITSTNRPQDMLFDWFLNPLLIIKEQIKVINLTEEEEDYLSRLVLLGDDPIRLKNSDISFPPESKCKIAELKALARRYVLAKTCFIIHGNVNQFKVCFLSNHEGFEESPDRSRGIQHSNVGSAILSMPCLKILPRRMIEPDQVEGKFRTHRVPLGGF